MSGDRHHKPIIGMAGGIGSGKSLVARQLESLGCAIIDSDAIARDALNQPDVRREIVDWLGEDVLAEDGTINRKAVASKVFNDPAALDRLESIIHPVVHRERARLREVFAADDESRAIVEDCPLLFEKGLDEGCDVVIFVAASRENRLARVASGRGWSAADLEEREKNQLSLDSKAQRADYVIENDGDAEHCFKQVRDVLSRILPD